MSCFWFVKGRLEQERRQTTMENYKICAVTVNYVNVFAIKTILAWPRLRITNIYSYWTRVAIPVLAVMHLLHVPSTTHSLAGNYAASCKDLEKTLKGCKDAPRPDLLVRLKRVLHHHNPTKFAGHVMKKSRQDHAWCNHSSASNNIWVRKFTTNTQKCFHTI